MNLKTKNDLYLAEFMSKLEEIKQRNEVRLSAIKEEMGVKYLLHPVHNVKRKEVV